MRAEGVPEPREGLDAEESRHAAKAGPAHEPPGRRSLAAHERALERRVDRPRLGRKPQKALCLGGSCEPVDRRGGLLQIRIQVEPVFRVPGVPGEHLGGSQRESVFQALAGIFEEFVKYLSQREYRGTGIHAPARDLDLAHLAARTCSLLEQQDLETRAC